MSLIIEQVKAWDGTSGTGADARRIINQNFERILSAINSGGGGGTINGKQKHFYQTTPPAANLVDAGDEWVDTNQDRERIKYTWTGSSFVNFND